MEEQSKLWLYETVCELKPDKLFIVKNRQTSELGVKRFVRPDQKDIYTALLEFRHPNLPKINAVLSDGERCVVLYEYMDGKSLQEWIRENRVFTHREVKNIANQICAALIALHNHVPPIIHRDIKLSNVILADNGNVTLIDFDAARFYDETADSDTTAIGTHGYAAPEAYGFSQTDARSDIYSLGVLINRLLTGKLPAEQLPDGKFKKIIKRCTDLSPQKRYHSIKELQYALKGQPQRKTLVALAGIAVASVIAFVLLWNAFAPLISATPSSKQWEILQSQLGYMAEIEDATDLSFPKVGAIPNEYANSYLFYYANGEQQKTGKPISTFALDETTDISVIEMSAGEVSQALYSAFGPERFDFATFKPNGISVFVQDETYFIIVGETGNASVSWSAENPKQYEPQNDYLFTATYAWPGEDELQGTGNVRLYEYGNSISGYYFQYVNFDPDTYYAQFSPIQGIWQAQTATAENQYLEVRQDAAYFYDTFDNRMLAQPARIETNGTGYLVYPDETSYGVILKKTDTGLLLDEQAYTFVRSSEAEDMLGDWQMPSDPDATITVSARPKGAELLDIDISYAGEHIHTTGKIQNDGILFFTFSTNKVSGEGKLEMQSGKLVLAFDSLLMFQTELPFRANAGTYEKVSI